jgi:hypothetical protein
MTPAEIAADLHAAIGEALQLFQQVDETRTTRRLKPEGWCAREVLGHLIDSACNNHRRFVVGQSPSTSRFDGYDQNEWVARQHYDKAPWRDLVAFWTAYNRHLAHVIASTPAEAAARTALAPDGSEQVSIAFLMEDYVTHLRHHLAQIQKLLAA